MIETFNFFELVGVFYLQRFIVKWPLLWILWPISLLHSGPSILWRKSDVSHYWSQINIISGIIGCLIKLFTGNFWGGRPQEACIRRSRELEWFFWGSCWGAQLNFVFQEGYKFRVGFSKFGLKNFVLLF